MLALLTMTCGSVAGESYQTSKKLPPLHHVIGIDVPEEMNVSDKIQLGPERKLECKSCHGLEKIDEIAFERVDKKARNFLRGGPYRRLDNFCFNCHDKKTSGERPNIHNMLDEAGQIKKEHCTYCHEEVQEERDRPHRKEEYKLRMAPEKLCYGCHLRTPHFNALGHQVKPSDKINQRRKASEKELGIILPLSSEGKVMCASCHSPHPPGLIDAAKNPAGKVVANKDLKTGVEYREHSWNEVIQEDKKKRLEELNQKLGANLDVHYQRIEKEVLLRLPAKDGSLCQACHEFER